MRTCGANCLLVIGAVGSLLAAAPCGAASLGDLLATAGRPAGDGLLVQETGALSAGCYAAPAIADLDGDGDTDLVVGTGCGDVLYYENEGRATAPSFAPPVALLVCGNGPARPGRGTSATPAVMDWDADGRLDLLVSMGGRLQLHRGLSARPLADPPQIIEDTSGASVLPDGESAAAPVDWDGNGLFDLIIGDAEGGLHFAANVGTRETPLFEPPVRFSLATGRLDVGGRARCVGLDIDGDGMPELVVGTDEGSILAFRRPDATRDTVVASAVLDVPPSHGDRAASWGAAYAPTVGDLTGDGEADLVIGTRAGAVRLLKGGADGRFAAAEWLLQRDAPIDVGDLAAPLAADWDGDGVLDIIVSGEVGTLTLFRGLSRGSARFAAGEALDVSGLPGAGGRDYHQPLVVDWEADGDLDLLIGGSDGVVYICKSARLGRREQLTPATPVTMAGFAIRQEPPLSLAMVDWNLDDDLDLFVGGAPSVAGYSGELLPRLGSPGIVYYENIATHRRQEPRFFKGAGLQALIPLTFPGAALRDASVLGLGIAGITDWSGRGDREFVLSSRDGSLYLFATATRPGAYPKLYLASDPGNSTQGRILAGVMAPALADLNADGRDDVIAGLPGVGLVRWYDRRSLQGSVYVEVTFGGPQQYTLVDRGAALAVGGTVTEWRVAIGTNNTRRAYRLKIMRPEGGRLRPAGESAWERVKPGWNLFTCDIPGVRQGDLLGIVSSPAGKVTAVLAAQGGQTLFVSDREVRGETAVTEWQEASLSLALRATVE